MDATPRAHPLTLRVMQLAKPGFARHDPVGYDEEGLALTRNVLHAENPRHYAPANVTEALQLPSSQGKVYLGESFSAFINICNDGHDVVTNVSLKVEMQTASQRHTSLADPESCRASKLERTQTLQTTIRHEIRSLGTHALLCAVSYTLLNGERRTFRKSFNFEVNQPLDVIPHCTTIQNTIVLEVQVKNQMPHPIHFQSIKFTPQSAFAVQDCNATLCQDGKTRSVFHGFQSVEPKPRVACTVMQIAVCDSVWIVDTLIHTKTKQYAQHVAALLEFLFACEHVHVLGFSFKDDVRHIIPLCPVLASKPLVSFTDVQQLVRRQLKKKGQPSLSLACERVFGRPLNKMEQCSNWERRPLRRDQLEYAAIDAWCLIGIYSHYNGRSRT